MHVTCTLNIISPCKSHFLSNNLYKHYYQLLSIVWVLVCERLGRKVGHLWREMWKNLQRLGYMTNIWIKRKLQKLGPIK
jgi:hypothetical protein